jgi:hypothetical protein
LKSLKAALTFAQLATDASSVVSQTLVRQRQSDGYQQQQH